MALIEHFDIDFLLPDAKDHDGDTALIGMCHNGRTAAMRLMVEKCNGGARRALGDPAAQGKVLLETIFHIKVKDDSADWFEMLVGFFVDSQQQGSLRHATSLKNEEENAVDVGS
eukprot:GABV01011716.1.p1 GENE.GABV01011716.1~~GABV01011716.1.p1  ORF type:complete len:114 (+),score=44.34 GABV01011716.1:42-383(+)